MIVAICGKSAYDELNQWLTTAIRLKPYRAVLFVCDIAERIALRQTCILLEEWRVKYVFIELTGWLAYDLVSAQQVLKLFPNYHLDSLTITTTYHWDRPFHRFVQDLFGKTVRVEHYQKSNGPIDKFRCWIQTRYPNLGHNRTIRHWFSQWHCWKRARKT